MDADRFAAALRCRREEKGLSLRQLAALVHFGKSYLSDLEHGHRVPHSETAARLDDVLGAQGELTRLAEQAAPTPRPAAQVLRVAIAVVLDGPSVLLVRRRDRFAGLSWQFPAGIVKPGAAPVDVAVEEVLAETGVVCAVRQRMGSRIHPVTAVHCDYLVCDYLSGEAVNRDPVENSAVVWLTRRHVLSVIPEEQLYLAVLDLMREDDGR